MNVRGGGGSGGTSGSGFRLGRCSSPATFSTLQPCLVSCSSTLSCLVPSLLYNPDLSLLPRFFYPPFYFTRTISCSTLLSSLSLSLPCSCLTLYLSRLARPTPGRQYFSILHITILLAHLVLSLCRMYPHLFTLDCEIKASISLESFTYIICSVLTLFVCSC